MDEQDPIPYGYCQCGCGEKTKLCPQSNTRRGYVKGEPRRYLDGHQGHAHRRVGPDYRVEDRGYVTPCWTWLRGKTKTGYGMVYAGVAHRALYEQLVGPVDRELDLDHLCSNRDCVNPAHLEPVTHVENVRRSRNRCKLTLELARDIRASGESPTRLAERYGVGKTTIQHVLAGDTWREG